MFRNIMGIPADLFRAIYCLRLRRVSKNILLVMIVSSFCLVFASCSQKTQPTENPQSNVVQLRNELISFAKGDLKEVKGKTEPEESYILLYGYPNYDLDSLPISYTLLKKLEAISPPPTEIYVLAHVYGNDIKEYTEWELKDRNSDHPLLEPAPFIINGGSFKITEQERQHYRVLMKIE